MRRIPELWKTGPFLACLIAAEGLAAIVSFAPGRAGDPWLHFAGTSWLAMWVTCFLACGAWLLRERLESLTAGRVAAVVSALVMAGIVSAGGVAHLLVGHLVPMTASPAFWGQLLLAGLLVALFAGAALVNLVRAADAAAASRQAQLDALHARIRPHFLFNTLNSAAALVHAQPDRAEDVLLDLAELFRAALSGPREASLADELALTRRYLEIEQLRFGDRLRVAWSQPEPLPALRLPGLCLQPLVENAIHHGVEPSTRGGTVEVRVEHAGGALRLRVRNPVHAAALAPGDASAGRRHAGHHVGLAATRARLEEAAPGALRTRIVDGHFEAEITLPCPDAATP